VATTWAWREKDWSDLNRTNDLLRVVGVKVTQSVKWPVPGLRFTFSVLNRTNDLLRVVGVKVTQSVK